MVWGIGVVTQFDPSPDVLEAMADGIDVATDDGHVQDVNGEFELLSGQYEPPPGLVGLAADGILLHRVAELVAQRFLEAVAHRLVGGTAVPDRNGHH